MRPHAPVGAEPAPDRHLVQGAVAGPGLQVRAGSVFTWFGLVIWFIEGSLSVITIHHTLELLDWKGFTAFGLLMSCNAVNHGPGLTHLRDLEHPLAGR